jgi:xanthine dehydrogenase YagT iron-sulfur-binding subunit
MQGKPQARNEPSERGLTPMLEVRLHVNGVERRLLLRPWTTLLGKHAARAALFGVLCVCESLLCLV